MSTDPTKDHIKKPDSYRFNIALLIVSVIAVTGMFSFAINNKTVERRDHYYIDVASWVQDVQEHVPDSEKRHTFVATVYAFTDDNVITDKEYNIIKNTYNDLKLSLALPSIHDNLKLMRAPNEFALRDTPASSS